LKILLRQISGDSSVGLRLHQNDGVALAFFCIWQKFSKY